MNKTHHTVKRLKNHLRRYTDNSIMIRHVLDTLGNEHNWQRMVDYIEYAERISEKLDIKRILARAAIYGLRRAPYVLRTVKRELNL